MSQETILRGFQSFVRVCGALHATIALDSFVGALCVNCLPEPFSLAQDRSVSVQVLNPTPSPFSRKIHFATLRQNYCIFASFLCHPASRPHCDTRQVSDKNLQCVHILFNTALCLGGTLGPSWRPILSSMQQVSSLSHSTYISSFNPSLSFN
jgi:hypothetical protein